MSAMGMVGGVFSAVDLMRDNYSADRSFNFQRQQFHDQKLYADTQYQRTVRDLQRAGLNPMLAVTQGMHGNQISGVGATPVGGGGPNPGEVYSAAALRMKQIQLLDQELANKRAEEARTLAETGEIQARTPVHATNIEHLKQQIGESAMRIEKIIAETDREVASAANIKQQTINLRETVPQIRATVDQLRAATDLKSAMSAETKQRIKAELPRLERELKELERYARELQQPGREQEAAVQSRFVGALGAVLRALNPLRGVLP